MNDLEKTLVVEFLQAREQEWVDPANRVHMWLDQSLREWGQLVARIPFANWEDVEAFAGVFGGDLRVMFRGVVEFMGAAAAVRAHKVDVAVTGDGTAVKLEAFRICPPNQGLVKAAVVMTGVRVAAPPHNVVPLVRSTSQP